VSRSPARRLWLLEIDLGHVYRFCTEAVVVEDRRGNELRFEPGLAEVRMSRSEGTASGEVAVGVEINAGVAWAELVARGTPLEGRSAILRRWTVGTILERAEVAIRGRTYAVSMGSAAEPLEVELQRSASEESRTLPHPQAAIDTTTWPITGGYTTPERSGGVPYPVIIGAPGHSLGVPDASVPVVYGQTGAAAATSYIVIADGPIDAGTVRLYDLDADPPTSADRTVSVVSDLLGRSVSVVTAAAVSDSAEYYIGLADASGYGLGVKHRGTAIRGAASVLRWALQDYTDLVVDWSRFDAAAPLLDAYKIDTWIIEVVNVWEWASNAVIPLLPIELRESEAGLYPVVWRWDATARDSVWHLDATRGSGRVSRAGRMELVADGIANEITVLYGPAADGGSRWHYRQVATARGRQLATPATTTPGDDSRVLGFGTLLDSQRIYGLRSETISAPVVWDHATAGLILRDVVRSRSFARRSVRYEGPPELETLRIGDVVTITDPELFLDRAVALVVDVDPGAAVGVDVLLLDDPRRTRRAT
jgi:hypothetical protein